MSELRPFGSTASRRIVNVLPAQKWQAEFDTDEGRYAVELVAWVVYELADGDVEFVGAELVDGAVCLVTEDPNFVQYLPPEGKIRTRPSVTSCQGAEADRKGKTQCPM